MSLILDVTHERLPLAREFRISRGAKTHADVVVVQLHWRGFTGRGEAVPYARYGESIDNTLSQLNALAPQLTHIDDHARLPQLMQAGAARNALDCAFWDLTANYRQTSVGELTGLTPPAQCVTAQTVSVGAVAQMQQEASSLGQAQLIKVKLGPDEVVEKIRAIHHACPDSQFIVDANEGWSIDLLKEVAPQLKDLNVALIEQPLPVADDAALEGYECPVPLCADESCHTSDNLSTLKKRYQAVNIKLDKTGGLTEAITLYNTAKSLDFKIMVGCMVASSLAMAPAFLLCNDVDFVDLDGPVLIKNDRPDGFEIRHGVMRAPANLLWGTGISL